MATIGPIDNNQRLSTTNTVQFDLLGIGSANTTGAIYVNRSNRIGIYVSGTSVSTGSDTDGIFIDTSFAPSSNVTNAASIGLFPTFTPPGGVTITTGYGLYIAAGTQAGAGSVTTGYGLFVTAPAYGTSNFAASIGGLVINSAGTGTITTGVWNGTAVDVSHGGTGVSSFTAYAPICGGTTTTNPLQSASTGIANSGFVLTSNGNAALPSFQSASASGAITTITGNSGGAQSPSAGNFNIVGTGSITSVGTANTETVQLTGLTNHAVLIGAGTATITKVGPVASTGAVLQSNGVGSDPGFSTATYPSIATGTGTILRADGTNWVATTATYPNSTTSQQILYSTANSVIGELTTANSKLPATNSSGTLAMRAFSVVRQVFTGNGTYTPTSGMLYCDIEVLGGGGGGGGATTGATGVSAGAGGGSGGYARKVVSAATIGASQSVTVGAAGAAATAGNNAGGTGGTSSVGSIVSATGGVGGAGCPSNTITAVVFSAGGLGGVGSSGDFNANGGQAQDGTAFLLAGTIGYTLTGGGANGIYGGGGQPLGFAAAATNNGVAASVYGGGGGGGGVFFNAASATGGAGAAGIVIITEYVIA